MAAKIKISETLLKELYKRENDYISGSRSAKVYLGSNWVKKISAEGEFSDAHVFQYELMEKNPNIFPSTKVKKFQKGLVILQKKIDVYSAEKIYNAVQRHFTCDDYCTFRDFLENIVVEGLIDQTKYIYEQNKKIFKKIEVGKWFEQFVDICTQLHFLFKKTPFKYPHRIDLHDENFGIEDGKLKFIDFMTYRGFKHH